MSQIKNSPPGFVSVFIGVYPWLNSSSIALFASGEGLDGSELACVLRLCRQAFDPQGDAGLGFVVEQNVHGIKANFIELQSLDVDDEIAGDEMGVFGEFDGDGDVNVRHDVFAVSIDEVEFEAASAFIAGRIKVTRRATVHWGWATGNWEARMESNAPRRFNLPWSSVAASQRTATWIFIRELRQENGWMARNTFCEIFPLDIHIISIYRASMIRKELVAASAELLIPALPGWAVKAGGYAIIQEVKERSGGKLNWTDGMLYPVLHRMERRGLITARWGESETGRKRKYYSLKKDGKAAMAKHHEQWSLVHSVLAGLKKEQYV